MARNMTTVQNANTIRFGSAKFEVGESEDNLVDLGAMRGIVFEETWDEVQIQSDNAGVIRVGINNHMAAIEGELMEINLETIAKIRGGIDKIENVPEDPDNGNKEAIRLLSGGISTFQPRVARITNYDDQNRKFQITIFKATPESGLNITFPEADSEDPAMTPIRMNGTLDVDRVTGEQLFEIVDEQGVAANGS